jgi:hypothetical protein
MGVAREALSRRRASVPRALRSTLRDRRDALTHRARNELRVLPECPAELSLQASSNGLRRDLLVGVSAMHSSALCGRSILLVEAEPAAAFHAEVGLRQAGAKVFGVHQLRDALFMAEHPALSAAVVAKRLGYEQTTAVCRRLTYLGVPFMLYATRYDATDARRKWPSVPVVAKPASTRDLITALAGLLH